MPFCLGENAILGAVERPKMENWLVVRNGNKVYNTDDYKMNEYT